ncbi:Class I SAM-dependent methyltransferase [Planctomycetales bacterium 10988]|nr:Class I SAM-dependent methyltransferase [Planctomycetales bacterium 10988]
MQSSHDHNRRAWDRLANRNAPHTRAAADEAFRNPLQHVDGRGWLEGSVAGKRLLCLAAGGGSQSALYAAAGAIVTVVDISPVMLARDREVAAERQLNVRTVEASMDDLSIFAEASFEVVIHPVSTCYVPKIAPVYREVARVLEVGGIYISQHKQPVSMQAEVDPSPQGGYTLSEPYFREGPLPAVENSLHREPGTLEYLHRLDEILGELCRSGFVIEEFSEPPHADAKASPGSFRHRSLYVPPYLRMKARRIGKKVEQRAKVWVPG